MALFVRNGKPDVKTGPLEIIRGRRVLVVADGQNLNHGSRDLGFRLSWRSLAKKFRKIAAKADLHVVFGQKPGDNRRGNYFANRSWEPHPKVIRFAGEANADNHLAFIAGHLCSRFPRVEVLVLGTGDGPLALDVADSLFRARPQLLIATLSLAGSTAKRLKAGTCELIQANMEIGLDVLQPCRIEMPI